MFHSVFCVISMWIWIVVVCFLGGGEEHSRANNFNSDLICRAGRNQPQFEAVMESFLGQAATDSGTPLR